MPIYEYRCPQGHTFELFQRMTDAPPDVCEVCGEAPVTKVLYPAAIHFKGSGFYSTDYGRGNRRPSPKDGGEGGGEAGEKKADKGESKPAESKAAEA
ncbi:MAG TPA: zinc ribbon domain-containing protein [Gaiellaceae bacterium]|jgi:putative FmdB family regulatory protein|nr:zinc ribbon domain-containing protein [Gaiellaceae bacterium]